MRWKHEPEPNYGDTRFVKKFLFFPTRINDETRWLEIVKVKQVYCVSDYSIPSWVDVSFID